MTCLMNSGLQREGYSALCPDREVHVKRNITAISINEINVTDYN